MALKAAPLLELRERDHHDGCPTGGERTESYTAVRPARPAKGEPAKTILIARCIDCGGHRTKEA